MVSSSARRRGRTASIVLVAGLALTACGARSAPSGATLAQPSGLSAAESTATAASVSGSVEVAAAGLVGAGCATHLRGLPQGAGSIARMAGQPTVAALTGDPSLTSVVAAVSGTLNDQVDLTRTLDGGPITVFAPVDTSFATVSPVTLTRFKNDRAFLTTVLRHHLVRGRLGVDQVVGRHQGLDGSSLTVSGSADHLVVAGRPVLCGGIRTANAVVYLIDGWIPPPD